MTKRLSQFDLARYESYHDVSLAEIDFAEAESQLTDERKKYLRTAAKEKAGQASGAGALSSVAKNIYSRMVKQAAVKQLWKEKREDSDVENDNTPLTDVEDEQLQSQGGPSQKPPQSAAKSTPPPPKKRKHEHDKQSDGDEEDGYDLTEILRSFELPNGQLEFSFEELFKATSMSKTKVKLTGWMLIMSKLAEVQMESTLTAADELGNQQEENEKLKQQVENLKQKNTKLTDTISQQQSVIKGIQGLLQHSGTAPAE